MKDPNAAVEFFTPELGLELEPYLAREMKQGIHHLARYQWARRVLEKREVKRILDIACGSGYGSFLLATTLPEAIVVGADYDRRAIDLAKGRYQADNLSYITADITRWLSEDEPLGRFDVVISFDTIEHLLHREIALLRICENLADDGSLFLSTPCGHSVTRLNPAWEHHKVEYSSTDLYQLLRRFFARVSHPHEADFPFASFWAEINRDKPRYLNKMNPLICSGPLRIEWNVLTMAECKGTHK